MKFKYIILFFILILSVNIVYSINYELLYKTENVTLGYDYILNLKLDVVNANCVISNYYGNSIIDQVQLTSLPGGFLKYSSDSNSWLSSINNFEIPFINNVSVDCFCFENNCTHLNGTIITEYDNKTYLTQYAVTEDLSAINYQNVFFLLVWVIVIVILGWIYSKITFEHEYLKVFIFFIISASCLCLLFISGLLMQHSGNYIIESMSGIIHFMFYLICIILPIYLIYYLAKKSSEAAK